MASFCLTNITVYGEYQTFTNGYIKIVEDKIVDVGSMDDLSESVMDAIEIISFETGYSAIPGMIDIHIHGVEGVDTMDATIEALTKMSQALPKEGTTSFLATTITQHPDLIAAALKNVADYKRTNNQDEGAELLGIHLEGPFINANKAGAQPIEFIRKPDVNLFKSWQRLAEGFIKIVTLAPEIEGAIPLINYLKKQGVITSIGHSDANSTDIDHAIQAGATHVTHLFNGMKGVHHREPGVAGAALLHNELKTELIADNIHVHQDMLHLAYKAKGPDNIMLITDAMRAKCLVDGTYDLGGQSVHVDGKKAILDNGTLAGSILKMSEALKNMKEITKNRFEQLIQTTSSNQAKSLNIFDRKGSLTIGKDADVVIIDEQMQVIMTICRGRIIYRRGD
ncbi:N-acetylglucosamine-6-phosphate deacetylase [Bacillus sp. HMF5848]|uniref:N-acetylglucosamine-6-phosphate deacetylase n=1 Tax=Bacillus sp. HMF5848 TaxID=2495421 RepID=UPI000F796A02|nr:N-acetylglucosamine-6-phosphate deacetylase [Bacillus sp. HMF5848]RSK26750.1 N-acetylglucosamine-6-phosphate deacetylase [Bacillus sp. HMF5848]